jgi:hypothetical protein
MDWGTFWTWVLQGGIVLVILFVTSAVVAAVVQGIREKK